MSAKNDWCRTLCKCLLVRLPPALFRSFTLEDWGGGQGCGVYIAGVFGCSMTPSCKNVAGLGATQHPTPSLIPSLNPPIPHSCNRPLHLPHPTHPPTYVALLTRCERRNGHHPPPQIRKSTRNARRRKSTRNGGRSHTSFILYVDTVCVPTVSVQCITPANYQLRPKQPFENAQWKNKYDSITNTKQWRKV